MENELRQRDAEYLEDRKRAHKRFADVVKSMHDELFTYRGDALQRWLFDTVDRIVTRLNDEEEELSTLRNRWRA